MENAVYWQGRQVGIEYAGQIFWFTSAPKDAITAYVDTSRVDAQAAHPADELVARNLLKVAN